MYVGYSMCKLHGITSQRTKEFSASCLCGLFKQISNFQMEYDKRGMRGTASKEVKGVGYEYETNTSVWKNCYYLELYQIRVEFLSFEFELSLSLPIPW